MKAEANTTCDGRAIPKIVASKTSLGFCQKDQRRCQLLLCTVLDTCSPRSDSSEALRQEQDSSPHGNSIAISTPTRLRIKHRPGSNGQGLITPGFTRSRVTGHHGTSAQHSLFPNMSIEQRGAAGIWANGPNMFTAAPTGHVCRVAGRRTTQGVRAIPINRPD